jgi:hypothetical protein
VQEDFVALPIIKPENGLETVYLWARSIAFYLKDQIDETGACGSEQGHRLLILHGIQRDLEARAQLGEKKYGERLKAFNGRDASVDAYQEDLDLCDYVRQKIEELEIKK